MLFVSGPGAGLVPGRAHPLAEALAAVPMFDVAARALFAVVFNRLPQHPRCALGERLFRLA